MDRVVLAFRNSNSIRLSWREWAAAALACAVALCLLPAVWPAAGGRFSQQDYRLPSELSSDYWMFRQWAEYSGTKYRAAVLGDSVMWGQYAKSGDTLTHHLNSLLGARAFANLGVDGLHPAAMAGMVEYYGGALAGRPVLVHLNPLWMTSPEQDLQGKGEARFNHPKLVAQWRHRPSSYRPAPAEAASAVLERRVSFLSWKEHLKTAYYDGMALQDWTLENPYTVRPAGRGPNAFSWKEPGSQPMTWRERGIEPQNLPWVQAARSYQWRSFRAMVERLRSRRSRVFVLVGPFNTHALTPESAARYRTLTAELRRWLEEEKIPYYAPPALATDLYADASHPLGEGYRALAGEMAESPSFRAWVKGWGPNPEVPRPRQKERS